MEEMQDDCREQSLPCRQSFRSRLTLLAYILVGKKNAAYEAALEKDIKL